MKWNKIYNYPPCTRSTTDGLRLYDIGKERLPSVTTILKATESEEKKESLKFSLIIQRQNLIWGNWLQALRDQSDIEDYRFDFY